MEILRTFTPVIVLLVIAFSAPLFHTILAAGQAAGWLWSCVRDAGAAPAPVSPAT
jgi:hypothetical protein